MPFPDLSPYDILELAPSATLADIMKAYQQALRRRRYPPARLQQAFNDLRNTRKRAEHDLLVYQGVGDPAAVRTAMAALSPAQFVSGDAAPLPIGRALTGLGGGDCREDFIDVPACPLTVQVTDRYRALETALPPLSFPA